MRINDEPIFRHLIGSELKQRILIFLSSNQAPVTEREMSRILGVSHTAVNKAMKQLLDLNAIEGRTIGKSLIWKLNEKSFVFPAISESVAILKQTPLGFVRNELSAAIKAEIPSLNRGIERKIIEGGTDIGGNILETYIIGSVAEGTAKPDSDIDILVILEHGMLADELRERLMKRLGIKILEKTGNAVSFHIYSEGSVKKNKPAWLKGAIARGIRVF